MKKKYMILLACITAVFVTVPMFYTANVSTVKATHLSKNAYEGGFEITGCIESNNAVPIYLSYPVYIKESYVSNNSYVNKGQRLFTLDLERMEKALKNSNYGNLENAEDVQVYASMNRSMLYTLPTEIYATESGTIKELSAEKDGVVFSGDNLCVIEQGNTTILKITIAQEDYARVTVGDTVVINPLIAPDRTYQAVISSKPATIRKEATIAGNKTVIDVYADIQNGDEFIIAGLQFTGKIIDSAKKEIYSLPYDFVNQDEQGEYVNIYVDGKIEKKYIETGIELAEEIEILTVFAKDTIFVENGAELKEKVLLKYEME